MRDWPWPRRWAAFAAGCLLFCACWLVRGAVRTDVCVDWVGFESMQQRFDHSEAVLIGKPLKRDGESRSYGHPANVHVVEVEQVLNGGLGHGPVCVASMPVTCGQTYPDGDPLDDGERKLIFLTDKHVQWFTMTPDRGTVQFPAGTALPFKTG